MTGNSTATGQACAACKYQRRKCNPECALAPYFPPDQLKQFLNVHKLFGVSNVLRILRQVDPSKRSDTMKSIVYEADAWEKDPVRGCYGVIQTLQADIQRLNEELEAMKNQILYWKKQQMVFFQQVQQQQLESLILEDPSHYQITNPWTSSYAPDTHTEMELAGSNIFRPVTFDLKPIFDTKTLGYDSSAAYGSSVEDYLTELHSVEHVPKHEVQTKNSEFDEG